MAGRLGFLKFIMGDLGFDREYLEELRAVDSARIKSVAKKYLNYHRMAAVVLVPKVNEKFDTQELDHLAAKYLHAEKNPTIVAKTKNSESRIQSEGRGQQQPYELIRLSSGVQVCYYPRPLSHAFSVHASVLGGVGLEIAHPIEQAERDWGSSYMMALSWTKELRKRILGRFQRLPKDGRRVLKVFQVEIP